MGTSEWHEITQRQVNLFADATGDHQWIHVDPQRAEAGELVPPALRVSISLAAPGRKSVDNDVGGAIRVRLHLHTPIAPEGDLRAVAEVAVGLTQPVVLIADHDVSRADELLADRLQHLLLDHRLALDRGLQDALEQSLRLRLLDDAGAVDVNAEPELLRRDGAGRPLDLEDKLPIQLLRTAQAMTPENDVDQLDHGAQGQRFAANGKAPRGCTTGPGEPSHAGLGGTEPTHDAVQPRPHLIQHLAGTVTFRQQPLPFCRLATQSLPPPQCSALPTSPNQLTTRRYRRSRL
ncbi:MaoC/PaaZ C-terminal domain-containing protein [Amycolatopsis keratiniphila]|uniref:MaoC family dehydratase n=1 Tax=Amycolatopsis keratiniphila TaxID=129921 RepID=UPI00373FDCC3